MTDQLADDATAGADDALGKDVDTTGAETGDKAADKATEGDKDTSVDTQATEGDKAAGDAAEGDKAQDGDKPAPLPDNWREVAADGDDDLLKELKRYGSLKGVAKALKEAKATIRSGVKETPMPDATDEKAMAEWRKAKGIPDDPTGYKLPEEVTKRLTDEDKPLIASFTEFAHSKNARPDVVELASEWYVTMAEQAEAKRLEEDKTAAEEAEEALRTSWGNGSYKGNFTLAERYAESIPGVGLKLAEFRGPDGRRLGDIPEFVEWASDMGREKFGDVTFASGDSANQHNNRKAEIEKIMNSDMKAYWADAAMQKEYQDILSKEAKRK
jgi:hypothetical protein